MVHNRVDNLCNRSVIALIGCLLHRLEALQGVTGHQARCVSTRWSYRLVGASNGLQIDYVQIFPLRGKGQRPRQKLVKARSGDMRDMEF